MQSFCRVINDAKGLLRCEYTKLIHKRCDKLADYEVAISSSKSVSSAHKLLVGNRVLQKEEIERRRCEYEALNTQVKHSLPRVIDGLNAVNSFFPDAKQKACLESVRVCAESPGARQAILRADGTMVQMRKDRCESACSWDP